MRHLVPGRSARSAPEPDPRPPAHTAADPASFAWGVVHRRHPRIVEQVRNANPYLPEQVAALDRLAAEMATEITPLAEDAPESAHWREWAAPHVGRRWDEVPFLWAESYFYRRLLDAVDFFTPGPWYRLDPFAHLKAAELVDPALEAELAELDWIADVDPAHRAHALLLAALRGNRADLGFAAHAAHFDPPGPEIGGGLVADDSPALWALLDTPAPRTVCLVADNAGRELLADLLLIDELLAAGRAGEVLLHIKPVPYFVSDATTADVAAALRRLAAAGGYAATAARRLTGHFRHGRIRLRTHPFHVAPLEFDAMPDDLAADFAGAALTLLKGDLNYRRLVGDRRWPAATPLAEAAGYFPGTVAALRTVKSEVVVGVDGAAALDRREPDWRISGRYELVQLLVRSGT